MPGASQFVAFTIASLLFIQIPGPSLLFTIGRALSVGRREALLSVVGNGLGLFVQVVAVTVGLGAVVATSATAFTALKLIGAAYVVWLGIQAYQHRADAREALLADEPPQAERGSLWIGLGVGTTNPKTAVFFAAFLPQFVAVDAPAAPQLLLLGTLFAVMAIASDSCWAIVAGRAREWFARRPERLDRLGATGGLLMIALGVTLATAE